jgi:hypothetical protein
MFFIHYINVYIKYFSKSSFIFETAEVISVIRRVYRPFVWLRFFNDGLLDMIIKWYIAHPDLYFIKVKPVTNLGQLPP